MIDPLTAPQQRVLGSLAEKAATVPDTYPMTLNGLRAACNQKTNRDPVTDYDEATVLRTLDELKAAGLVRFVYASHGARTTKYRHVLDEVLGLDPAALALLTVMLVRGPQTVNELRVRTERAHPFEDNDHVVETLRTLAGRDEPLVVELPRSPGQKELRWTHLLGPTDHEPAPQRPAEAPREVTEPGAPDRPGAPAPPTVQDHGPDLADRVTALEARVAALEALLTEHEPPAAGEHEEHHR